MMRYRHRNRLNWYSVSVTNGHFLQGKKHLNVYLMLNLQEGTDHWVTQFEKESVDISILCTRTPPNMVI